MVMTKQRQMILEYFQQYPETHPTAEELYDYVKRMEYTIGIATVYRNLKKLVEIDILRELNLEKQGVRYDLAAHEHYHFICDNCGSIKNFVIPELVAIDKAVEQQVQGTLTYKDLIFHGICAHCLNNE